MVTEPLFDGPHTITATQAPYDGSSSSSQEQVTLYNNLLHDPQFLAQPTNASNTQVSDVVTVPGMYNVSSNAGDNQLQIAAEVSPDYQRNGSNNALHYISQILLEDVDERASLHQGETALQAAEKSFYDILGQVNTPSLNWPPLHTSTSEADNHGECSNYYQNRIRSTGFSNNGSYSGRMLQPLPAPWSSYSSGRSLFLPHQPLTSNGWVSRFGFPAFQFSRGVKEADRCLSSIDKLVIDLDRDRLSICKLTTNAKVGEKSKYAVFEVTDHWNNPYIQDLDTLEGRSSKRCAITYCEIIRNETYDRILLCYGPSNFDETRSLQKIMANEASKNSLKGQNKGLAQRRLQLQGKKQVKKEVVDLRALLIQCAQAVAADDRLVASQLIKKIKQYSSADGDSTQRLAFYLVDGLEARLAGIGSQLYHNLMAKRAKTEDVLNAYNIYLAACPFDRASYTFANETILDASNGQQRVHIIDFGICFGFQWPSLIQRFAEREGGPPKLRITGIAVPRPGLRPLEMIEETGKRLADYANLFSVPFQYQGIASKWETIQIEDLNIEEGEVVMINCMFRMKNLGDETVAMNSARDKVLKTMRRINPKVFVLGIVNGSYSSPFFMTRFKEVLFHYSSLFDMLDANVPRDKEARKMLEKEFFGRDALNIIACEGAERTERPETYKQWRVRCLKAGFEQIPVDPSVLNVIVNMKKGVYHVDFVADEDGGWLLQGWKGRVIFAVSKWRPNESYDDQ
ncbi:hypothetical protein ACP70R_031714 [Stipagrostis hirtigluma subsp. patula]